MDVDQPQAGIEADRVGCVEASDPGDGLGQVKGGPVQAALLLAQLTTGDQDRGGGADVGDLLAEAELVVGRLRIAQSALVDQGFHQHRGRGDCVPAVLGQGAERSTSLGLRLAQVSAAKLGPRAMNTHEHEPGGAAEDASLVERASQQLLGLRQEICLGEDHHRVHKPQRVGPFADQSLRVGDRPHRDGRRPRSLGPRC